MASVCESVLTGQVTKTKRGKVLQLRAGDCSRSLPGPAPLPDSLLSALYLLPSCRSCPERETEDPKESGRKGGGDKCTSSTPTALWWGTGFLKKRKKKKKGGRPMDTDFAIETAPEFTSSLSHPRKPSH